ncbi:hypothetical protein VTK26DRAFT_5681 [Humicola hyalothermophila]
MPLACAGCLFPPNCLHRFVLTHSLIFPSIGGTATVSISGPSSNCTGCPNIIPSSFPYPDAVLGTHLLAKHYLPSSSRSEKTKERSAAFRHPRFPKCDHSDAKMK